MSAKYLRGSFVPENPEKYVGTYPIIYRSSWELTVMRMCDKHQNILQWASESMKIPYVNPFTNKYTVYVPDFIVVMEDRDGRQKVEMWEVKPSKQTYVKEAKQQRDQMALAVNAVKWKAASIFCKEHNMTFRVITENDIYRDPRRK
jgi:hypothetical protein